MEHDKLSASIAATPGPRVTAELIESRIADIVYTVLPGTPASPGERVTICQIVLDNGFDVRGEAACVSPENFNREIGQKIAYDDAFRKLWPLFAFLLAEDRMMARNSTLGNNVEIGSGNVFADIGLLDSDALLQKARAARLVDTVDEFPKD